MEHQSNFSFLNEWQDLMDKARIAEQKARSEPRTSLIYARMALELAVNWMFNNDDELEMPFDKSLNSLMNQIEFQQQFNQKLYRELHLIKKSGNLAVHNKPVSEVDSLATIEQLYYFTRWFAKSYGSEVTEQPGVFDWELIPQKDRDDASRRETMQLIQQLETQLQQIQQQQEKERERKEKLLEENELYQKQLEVRQEQLEVNKNKANTLDIEIHPRNEQETRKRIIDVTLREAGWDLQGANDKEFKVQFMPKSTNTSETGYVDYVLWDDDGTPLALVEAKKTMENASKGENQTQLYADALEKMYGRRPVMYYTNGFDIYLWDDQFYKAARLVHGFYTKSELQTMMFRRSNRKDIRKLPIDTKISGRTYQMRAIKSITEHIAGNDKATGKLIGTNRGALLVLATGTGKTRTAIAFSKLMLEANWAKRILFLADRVSLVKQAKSNFVKLMPEHTSVNLLEEKDNPDARLAFSTYQTMMGLIDNSKLEKARFYGVGHFDLIIIDEAHRSIYQKYSAIFEYFDAILLGLTATPKNSIDHNTYKVFGLPDKSPTDAYAFDEAVNDGFLSPYSSIEMPTKFLKQGIYYKDLNEEEKEQFEKEILDGGEATGNEWIPKKELDEWLFNKNTAFITLDYILKHGIKKRGGDEIGKTIVFAKSKKHAQFLKDMFLEMDKERFGNDYVKVITHGEPKAQEFIERFCDEEKDRLPQIAISVDMMDTGIDAPSCVNLVFYKPVRSYTKFWQMIGRGSRLRPDLFGPGQDKKEFLIFDLMGNFEFFDENPKGKESTVQKSITEIVFSIKLQLAVYLKEKHFSDDEGLKKYRQELLDDLHHSIATLNTVRFDVKMQHKTVMDYGGNNRELWNHLSNKDIKIIEDILAPLIQPKKGETDLARYYDKLLYSLMIKRMETPNGEQFKKELITPITKVAILSKKLLKKVSIPQVQKNIDIVKMPLEEEFWLLDGLKHLEKIRAGIRNLLVYIDKEDQRYVTTDFEDELDETKIITKGAIIIKDPEQTTTSPFTNNIFRLEQLIRQNEDHITINRIKNGETITKAELKGLEKMLFNSTLSKEELDKELGDKVDLKTLIISLLGRSSGSVDKAFADFINEHQLNSVQIEFLNTIKKFITQNGQINPEKLYDSPFKDYHSLGVDGVFNEQQADKIFQIITHFNESDTGA